MGLIPDDADFDTITKTGIYMIPEPKGNNAPPVKWGAMVVFSGMYDVVQFAFQKSTFLLRYAHAPSNGIFMWDKWCIISMAELK